MHPFITHAAPWIALMAALAGAARMPTRHAAPPDVALLGPIVGEWQSDTVGGVSARSSCVWTPRHGGVLCEQRIDRAAGESTALNLFTTDSSTGDYVLYVLSRSGDVLSPVPLAIRGAQWLYGGKTPEHDGRFYRTVNDFSRPDAYVWRQESSADGQTWTAGVHGRMRRLP